MQANPAMMWSGWTFTKIMIFAAGLLHFIMAIVTVSFWSTHDNQLHYQNSYKYAYYKSDYVASNPPLTNTTDLVNKVYKDRCHVDKNTGYHVLGLTMKVYKDDVYQNKQVGMTWFPRQASFVNYTELNGYAILMSIFIFSCIFEFIAYHSIPQDDTKHFDFTRYPCAFRWMEYAVTSPLMILLIASSLMIRDIYVVYMLMLAQVAVCQMGYAVEYAIANKYKDDQPSHSIGATELVGLVDFYETKVDAKGKPNMTNRLFWFSFSPAVTLHVGIWAVLIGSFEFQEDTNCTQGEQTGPWKDALRMVIYLQLIGFTTFAIIPVFQAMMVRILGGRNCFMFKKKEAVTETDCEETMASGYLAYTIVNVIVKVLLGITYISFVRMYPFSTKEYL